MAFSITTGSVLLLVLCVVSLASAQGQRLDVINSNDVPQNPLSLIFVQESNELTVRFGLSFLEQLRLIKDSCHTRALQMERNFQDSITQLRQYQSQTVDILESSGMANEMSEEQKEDMKERLRESMNELLREQEEARKNLTENCTKAYEKVFADEMSTIMSDAKAILRDGGSEVFAQFINGINKYGRQLQRALNDCIDLYTPFFRVHGNIQGSADDLCMRQEVETLLEFMRSFLIKAEQLLDVASTSTPTTDTMSSTSSNGLSQQSSSLSPSSTPTDHKGHHHGGHHHGNHHHGNHHHGGHHHGGHHHGGHHHGGHHHGDHHHGNGHHHGNHHHGNHHHHGNDRTSSVNQPLSTPSPHSRPHKPADPSDIPKPTHPHHPHPHQTSTKPRPTGHIDVIIEVEPSSTSSITDGVATDDRHDIFTIIIFGSILTALFFMFVIIIGGALLCIRYHSNKRRNGWKNLSEEEKVSQMKSSGYVNPTYKFFDQVTQ